MLKIRSTRVVLPDGERPASIHILNGRITEVDDRAGEESRPPRQERTLDDEVIDFGGQVISPGIVDTHVHVNEPGRTEWEGFDTATRAAAAGGVTTVVDMPLNSIPATTTVAALEAKRAAARGRCHVDVAFWGGVVPGHAKHLDALVEAGVRGFKCFLVPSGVDEFPAVAEDDLRAALPLLVRQNVPLLVHAESPGLIRSERLALQTTPSAYSTYLTTRPPEAEVDAIRFIVHLANEFGVRVHIVHVAAAEAVEAVERAKARGVSITAETCPHYLTFSAEEIPNGATEFKCAPPIRESRHRRALWDGLRRGILDLIATDHSPAPPTLKCPGDFIKAWGGIASLQLSLPVVWSALLRTMGRRDGWSETGSPALVHAPEDASAGRVDLAKWMSERPSALAGLEGRKGRIAPGYDADLVVWDPESEFVVDRSRLEHRHKLTPYHGRRLHGSVVATYVRGIRSSGRSSIGELL